MDNSDSSIVVSAGTYSVQAPDFPDGGNGTFYYYPWEMRRLPKGTSSPLGAVFIVVNAALGAGLLAFPFAFYSAGGVAAGVAIEACLIPFIVVGLLIMAYTAELKQAATYEDVVNESCGALARVLAEVCIVTFSFGSSTAYLVVVGDQIQDITSAFYYHGNQLTHYWWVDRRFLIVVSSLLFILPWLFLKRIGILSYTSFLAVLSCLYIAVIVTVKKFTLDPASTCHGTGIPSVCSRSWEDSFLAIPFICFGFQCHLSSVPVYAGLKQRSVKVYAPVIVIAVAICVSVYTFTGAFGYLTFNTHYCIASDILRNYCPGDVPIDVARGMLAVVMITSYPILVFCGRTALDSLVMTALRPCKQLASVLRPHPNVRLRVASVVWFFLSLLLSIFVPQISYIISLTGGLAATFIFVFPGMVLLSLIRESSLAFVLRALLFLLAACFIVLDRKSVV